MNSVGVVGAGTMGLGIAQVCASAGCEVYLFDVNSDQTVRALKTIEHNLSQGVAKGKLSEEQRKEALSRIHKVERLEDLKADLVIEAAVERLDVKIDLLRRLEDINDRKTVLTSNTSSLSITQIAKQLKRPSQFLGFHFFNPADKMKLVEIISGEKSDHVWVEKLKTFSLSLGKIPVWAKDSPGFIVNRVARHFYVESLKIAGDRVTDYAGVDRLIRSAGFKMGPFELMDLIGVDTNLAVTQSVYEGLNKASKFKPNPIQVKLVEEGNYGRKSGKGFYDYHH